MPGTDVHLRQGTRITITGGSGFIGEHLTRTLCTYGAELTVFDLMLPQGGQRVPGAAYRAVDLRSHNAVRAAVADAAPDIVFHLAGNASGTASVQRPRFDFETNAGATFTLCEALAESSARKLVYLSSAMVYGRPQSCPIPETHPLSPFLPYAASKLSGEHVVRSMGETFGLATVIGRAFTVYGPGEDPHRAGGEVSQFLRRHLNHLPIDVAGDPDRKSRDFVHVGDLVEGLILLAERGGAGEVFNLGSGTETTLWQLAVVIGEVTGRPARLNADLCILEDTYRHVADIAKLRSLGYAPRTDIAAGVRSLAGLLGEYPQLPSVATVFRRPASVPAAPLVGADA